MLFINSLLFRFLYFHHQEIKNDKNKQVLNERLERLERTVDELFKSVEEIKKTMRNSRPASVSPMQVHDLIIHVIPNISLQYLIRQMQVLANSSENEFKIILLCIRHIL